MARIIIISTQRGYTDLYSYGPFDSISEAKEEVTDGRERGYDGDETRFTFFEITPTGMNETGYVLFYDEYENEGKDLREEYFIIRNTK